MVTNYTIQRVSKNLYIVKAGDEIVQECATFVEAENYVFSANTKELMSEYQQVA